MRNALEVFENMIAIKYTFMQNFKLFNTVQIDQYYPHHDTNRTEYSEL